MRALQTTLPMPAATNTQQNKALNYSYNLKEDVSELTHPLLGYRAVCLAFRVCAIGLLECPHLQHADFFWSEEAELATRQVLLG